MKKKIAFQGAFGANSDLACNQFYPEYEKVCCENFFDLFRLVINEEVNCAILPLENSYAGRVAEIHDLLKDEDVFITREHFFSVSHHLLSVQGSKLEEIQEIYSHPQAFMQSKNNLSKLGKKQIEYSNTAKAAEFIKNVNDKTKAAIASKLAAKLYNLKILKENIEDNKHNITTFVTISNKSANPDPEKGKVITTMLFTVRNIPGALYKVLGGLATNSVNMLKLESYIPGCFSEKAQFFISIEGHPNQKNVSLALEEMGFFSKYVKLLGVYYADKKRYEIIDGK